MISKMHGGGWFKLVVVLALIGILTIPLQAKTLLDRTVEDVVALYGPEAQGRLITYFKRAGLVYPPQKLAFIAMKKERKMELWVQQEKQWHFLHTYSMRAFSGQAGPKLREGDLQIPEGIYRIVALNPNSSYHLSMKLNYPNTWDWMHANREGRDDPGSNIFIHGRAVSIGCLAMGDTAIEELFILVDKVGMQNTRVIIAPRDIRKRPMVVKIPAKPEWLPDLYAQIEQAIKAVVKPKKIH